MSLRSALVALLAAATILFAIGVIAEPSPAAEPTHEEATHEPDQLEGAESTPLVVLAVVVGLALAAGAATRLGRRRAFLLAVAAIALAWAALDARELAHQLDESRAGIAAIAAAVALLHLGAAAAAGTLARG
jgi:hypothetical protein